MATRALLLTDSHRFLISASYSRKGTSNSQRRALAKGTITAFTTLFTIHTSTVKVHAPEISKDPPISQTKKKI